MLAVFFMESQIAGRQYHICLSNIGQSMATSLQSLVCWHPAINEWNAVHVLLLFKGHSKSVSGMQYIQYAHITIKHSLTKSTLLLMYVA